MDFASLGLNLGIIAGICGVTRVLAFLIKDIAKLDWLENHIVIIPLIFGLIIAVTMAFVEGQFIFTTFVQLAVSYAGVSAWFYDLFKNYGQKK